MGAENTDLLMKVASNTGWQLGASGFPDAEATTVALVSAAGLPTDTAVLVTVDRVDQNGTKTPSKMERFIGVVSGDNLVNCVRGVEGTAQAHSGGAVVEIVICASNINKLMQAILAEHKQDGKHGAVHADSLEISSVTWENLIKGWQEAGESWVYVAANQFKIVGVDLTAKYTKGAKIKVTNDSAVKYFYIVSSAFATDTTVTVSGEVDLVDGAITAPFYSYNDCPQGFKKGEDWYKAKIIPTSGQTLADSTFVKIVFTTEVFDVNSNFNSNKYEVPVSGYYDIRAAITITGGAPTRILPWIYVNGSNTSDGIRGVDVIATQVFVSNLSGILYLEKGSYIELYCLMTGGSRTILANFQSFLSINFIGV